MPTIALLHALTTLVSSPVFTGDESATDRMMALANRRFGEGFWRQSPARRYGTAWLDSPLVTNARLSQAGAAIDLKLNRATEENSRWVDGLREQALAHLDDPIASFRWGYAATKLSGLEGQQGRSYWKGFDRARQVSVLTWLLASNDLSKDYPYVRLRFLFEGSGQNRPELLPLGERLLAKKPWDAAVKAAMASNLGTSRRPEDLVKAASMADELVRLDPTHLAYVALEEYINETRWLAFKGRPEDARKVVEWSRRYLALAPPGAPNRQGFERAIDMVSTSHSPAHHP